jgi:hypothetical protein
MKLDHCDAQKTTLTLSGTSPIFLGGGYGGAAEGVPRGFNLLGLIADNTANAALTYIRFYDNLVANVAPATDTPFLVIPILSSQPSIIDGLLNLGKFTKGFCALAATTPSGAVTGVTLPLTVYFIDQ